MPIFEQGYRKYVGERASSSRAFAIAWENIRPRMRWWCWVLLLLLLAWPYVIYGVLMFVATMGQALFGASATMPIAAPTVAFERSRSFNPGTVLGLVQGNSLVLFWEVLQRASLWTVIFPAVVCAGLLASDRRTGALQIYFSRPVSRRDYLLGKALACTFFVALTTAIPCFILWAESVAFGSSANFTWRTWAAPFAIVCASSFYALWAVALVLSLSAIMRRPAFVALLAIIVQFALEGIGEILAKALRNKEGLGTGWHVIQPSYAIGSVTAPMCGLSLPPWINPGLAIAVAVGIPAALLAFVWFRLRAVEVAT